MKLKEGYCPDCTDKKLKPLIAKKCQFHYWGSRNKKSVKKNGKIPKVSKSQRSRTRKYLKLRKAYLLINEFCEAKIKCEGTVAVDIHHKAGKVGENYFKHFLPVCRACHDHIELHPEDAKKLNLSINRLT